MKGKYIVITGDLKESRKISKRKKIQEKLKIVLDKINNKYRKNIKVKFSITLGDEFQGLIDSLALSYIIIKDIKRLLFPLKISFGVGVGKISTKFSKRTSEMDGEAFFRSRKALGHAKNLKQNIYYITGDKNRDEFINTIIMLIEAIRRDWKEIHWRRVWRYEELGTFEKVAKQEGVSKQMISKMFNEIKYDEVKKAEEILEKFLSTI